MAFIKQTLSQKLLQKLSPQQIQFIKLLQLNTLNFEQRVQEELIENPALEEGADLVNDEVDFQEESSDTDFQDDFDISDYLQDDDTGGVRMSESIDPNEDKEELPIVALENFRETLEKQVLPILENEEDEELAQQLIGSFEDDGYLRRPIKSIVNDLLFTKNIQTTEAKLEEILKLIQEFDPPGVGCRDLQECLTLQLERREELSGKNPILALARIIVEDHFQDFSKKHYQKIIDKLEISEAYLKEGIELISKLNPKPAAQTGGLQKRDYIIPDFIVKESYGELEIILNQRNSPELRISKSFEETLRTYGDSDKKDKQLNQATQFVKQKIDGAKWFVESVKQRRNTLLSTMRAIVDFQKNFFHTGDEKELKPMILKDIADKINMDISTISRVANSKYVETSYGIFVLKFFFSEGIMTASGEEVSTREVKRILQEEIDKEDKFKPLTDEKLMQLLKERGYKIARRTVAKYREQLNIPVGRLRKQL